MRTALVVAAPGAVACGGEEGTRARDTRQDVASAGAGGAQPGAAGANGGVSGGSAQGGSGAPGAIVLEVASDPAGDAGADAEPYAPIPIYGGVFPDPMSRARV